MRILRWLFSPIGFVVFALLVIGLYRVCDAWGWRTYTCILSGSVPEGTSYAVAMWRGSAYALLYFGSVLLAPILLIAAALHVVVFRRVL